MVNRDSTESWLSSHAGLCSAAILVAGFAARFWTAHGTFLNADEAVHFRIANQATLAEMYRASLVESHPPLLYFVLHILRAFGTSELWLRLPSVFADTVFCWLLYRWMSTTMSRLAAFVGLIMASLLPPMVRLSAEIRQYALLIVFLMAALYLLDRALDEDSAWKMAGSAACLYLGMLSHYSAMFFVAALGVYGLLRIFLRAPTRPTSSVMAVWLAAQLGALALLAFLYVTHLSHLGRGESRGVLQGWMSEYYLRRSYFEAGRDNPALFAIGHSFGVFQFIFGQLAVGDVAGLIFLAGAVLLWRRSNAHNGDPLLRHRILAAFLLFLFALVCGASLAHVYPYGGTRHSSLLIIPALAGVGFATAHLAKQRWARGVAAALAVVLICAIFGKQHQPFIARADQSTHRMTQAIDFLRQNVGHEQLIFTDYESSMILGHYLCDQKVITVQAAPAQFVSFTCGGYRVVSANGYTATNFTPDVFLSLLPSLAATYGFDPGNSIWIFQAGWLADLPEQLRERPEYHDLPFRSFGNNIKIFRLNAESPTPAN
jgi:Dolichyl-phosphate-mannose-protein mannosyltransferase